NPGGLLHDLVSRPFAPAEERISSLAMRLARVPDALADARAVLQDMPRVHVETAVGQFGGTATLVRNELAGLLAEAPALAQDVEPLQTTAARELDEFAAWLRERLDDAAGADRDPRIGRRLWEARLWHALDSELTAKQILDRAEANLDRVSAELREAAAEFLGEPATDKSAKAALDRLGADHPDDATIVDSARHTLDEATAYVREHDLISLIDDPIVIMEMPEFSRGVAVAYCDPPGMLETAGQPTFYCISPTPSEWTPERVESFYREYNHHMLRNLTVHEAMPGHFLQLA